VDGGGVEGFRTSYCLLPALGATLANPLVQVNMDYWFGFSDTAAPT